MSPVVKFGLLAVLAAIAALYFAVVVWRAGSLTLVLLHRGYAERGWNEERLASRVRLLGWVGLALSIAAFAGAILRIVG